MRGTCLNSQRLHTTDIKITNESQRAKYTIKNIKIEIKGSINQ